MRKFLARSLCVLLASACGLLTSTVAAAGNEGGAGGNGVIIGGKPMLIDFVEYGIEEDPHFDETFRNHRHFVGLVLALKESRIKDILSESEIDLMAVKLLEIGSIDNGFATIIYAQFKSQLRFYLVNQSLLDVWASRSDIQVANRVQLAVRRHQEVRIDKALFASMSSGNRIGLLMHEALNHLMPPDVASYEAQRKVVAHMFMSDLRANGGELLFDATGRLENDWRIMPIYGVTYFDKQISKTVFAVYLKLDKQSVYLNFYDDPGILAKKLCGNRTSGLSTLEVRGLELEIRRMQRPEYKNSYFIYGLKSNLITPYKYQVNGSFCELETASAIDALRNELKAKAYWAAN